VIVGVPKETFPGETRVALVPETAASLVKEGVDVLLETGAGQSAGFPDAGYRDREAVLVENRADLFSRADVIAQVRGLGANRDAGRSDLDLVHPGQVLIGLYDPLSTSQAAADLAERQVTVFAMELIPRISRAQPMDALSSMATVAGYRAVLLAAGAVPKMFPMMMTAAGTVTPARVLVLGAGVAGLQAIATAKRLGAVVQAYDVRPQVAEQIESLGARFVELGVTTADTEDAGGYAKTLDNDAAAGQREALARVVAQHDVVIATAAVPGRPAPLLVTEQAVRDMAPGSVIVDLAAERGGNCELTQPDEEVRRHGVTIIGPTNPAAQAPYHASQMYARNVSAFLRHLVADGGLRIDLDDEITRGALAVRDGLIVHSLVREALGLDPSPEGDD